MGQGCGAWYVGVWVCWFDGKSRSMDRRRYEGTLVRGYNSIARHGMRAVQYLGNEQHRQHQRREQQAITPDGLVGTWCCHCTVDSSCYCSCVP